MVARTMNPSRSGYGCSQGSREVGTGSFAPGKERNQLRVRNIGRWVSHLTREEGVSLLGCHFPWDHSPGGIGRSSKAPCYV